MDLVVDTSAVLAVLLDEPARHALILAAEGYQLVGAPTLRWEIGSALVAAFRRRRLSALDAHRAWSGYVTIPVRVAEISAERALEVALETGLYAYDAYVLETARAERIPLLTIDAAMGRAARRLGIRLRGGEE